MNKIYAIIGTSAAGISCAQKLRILSPTSTIICISDEPELPYNKCFLVDVISGLKPLDAVYTLTSSKAHDRAIELMLAKRVVSLNASQSSLVLDDGQRINYDAVLLATGSCPFVPQALDVNMPGVFTFHSLHDIMRLQEHLERFKVARAAVIGAGLTGIEAADALCAKGIEVTILERSSTLLSSLMCPEASAHIERCAQRAGVHCLTNESVTELLEREGRVCGIRLASGPVLDVQLVIIATGVRPNSQLIADGNFKLFKDLWAQPNQYGQLEVDNLYAAGDVCALLDQLTNERRPNTTWPDAVSQGMHVASAMVGNPVPYLGLIPYFSSSFFGMRLVCGGTHLNNSDRKSVSSMSDDLFQAYQINSEQELSSYIWIGTGTIPPQLRRWLMTREKINERMLTK